MSLIKNPNFDYKTEFIRQLKEKGIEAEPGSTVDQMIDLFKKEDDKMQDDLNKILELFEDVKK